MQRLPWHYDKYGERLIVGREQKEKDRDIVIYPFWQKIRRSKEQQLFSIIMTDFSLMDFVWNAWQVHFEDTSEQKEKRSARLISP